MQDKLSEARDLVEQMMTPDGNWPIGLVAVHRLLAEAIDQLDEQWDPDDVVTLPMYDDEDFPAA